MAKKIGSEMQAWARMGVEARLAEIEAEKARILRAFPGLRSGAGAGRGGAARKDDGGGGPAAARKPRKMSAAARKRISDAQKKRWAAQKAAKR
jgi:hypothetical protein